MLVQISKFIFSIMEALFSFCFKILYFLMKQNNLGYNHYFRNREIIDFAEIAFIPPLFKILVDLISVLFIIFNLLKFHFYNYKLFLRLLLGMKIKCISLK